MINGLPQEIKKKMSITQLCTSRDYNKQIKPKVRRREEITKIKVEMNELGIKKKKTREKISETKNWFFENIKLTNLHLESPEKRVLKKKKIR